MKRNKRSEVLGQESLSPLTDHILEQMGAEGVTIRERLETFYRERSVNKRCPYAERLEESNRG